MKDILTGFKSFLLRGNLIEIAVAFVMALAFTELIQSFVSNLLTPIIAMIFGEPSLGGLDFEINDAVFFYGFFLDDLISFIGIAFALYFFVVVPYTRITERMRRGETEEGTTTKTCPECVTTIPLEARRCPACTTQLVS
jgi:large conductance mechanosensitive channel